MAQSTFWPRPVRMRWYSAVTMPSARCKPGAGIADLRAGDERRAVAEAGGRSRAAGALRDVLVDLAVFVGARAEALHRGDDHARIELVDVLPGQPHAVERAGREILDQHVAMLHQPIEDFLALGMLGVDRDRALRAIEHGEIEAVGALHVAQLAARDVADAGPFDLDHVGAHIGEQLRAGRPRLHVREVENFHAFERPARLAPRLRADGRGRPLPFDRLRRRLLCLELHDFLGGFFAAAFGLCFGCFLRVAIVSSPSLSVAERSALASLISCEARFSD